MDILPNLSDRFPFSVTVREGDRPLTCNNRQTTGKESSMKNNTWNKEEKRKFLNSTAICSLERIKDKRTLKMEVQKQCYQELKQKKANCLSVSNTRIFHRRLQTMFRLQFIVVLILSFVGHGRAQESSTVGKSLFSL